MKGSIATFGRVLGFGLLLCVGAAACERHSREQAGVKGAPAGVPVSASEPRVVTLAAASNVAEVAPKLGSGAIDGQALFTATCAACHQATGQGVPSAFPPLDGSSYVLSSNVERMASIMLYGLTGPINVKGSTYSNIMLPQRQLKDEELAAIATYVRSSWSNKAGPVDPGVFAAMRKKYGERGQFTIQELGEEPQG